MANKLVYGVGINDADYQVNKTARGAGWCPAYSAWKSMLKRCYSHRFKSKNQTYTECCVCDEWLTFSGFKTWMETQDWEGKQLDKDLLVDGNKIYSPESCVFVSKMTNTFTTGRAACRGDFPIGVDFNKKSGMFRAQCRNPFSKKKECLGYFQCPEQAHQAWRRRKHELACQLAELQTDQRVANALRSRYA